jgi:hypothetical protein
MLMILSWNDNMYHIFIFFTCFCNINSSEISNVCFDDTFGYLNANNCLLISDSQNTVTVLLILISKVRDHFIFFKLDFSVFGLKMNINFSWLLGRNFYEDNTLSTWLFSKALSFRNQLFSFLFLAC